MAEGFVKFPRTPHLMWLGESQPRGDKLLAAEDARRLLAKPTAVEEKVDGANLGLSIGPDGRVRAQSRGHYLELGTQGQWKPLWRWLAVRGLQIASVIDESLVVFGEWCYAEHSIAYDSLPDWFLVFDVYDKTAERFWSRRRRDELSRYAGLAVVPLLGTGAFAASALRRMMGQSRLGLVPAEGIYLRWDDDDWLSARAKIVRAGWVMASDEHWSARPIKVNRLATEAAIQTTR